MDINELISIIDNHGELGTEEGMYQIAVSLRDKIFEEAISVLTSKELDPRFLSVTLLTSPSTAFAESHPFMLDSIPSAKKIGYL